MFCWTLEQCNFVGLGLACENSGFSIFPFCQSCSLLLGFGLFMISSCNSS